MHLTCHDLRKLTLADFRPWLEKHLCRWQNDPVFAQRWHIRDLRRRHPRLTDLEDQYRQTLQLDAASVQFQPLTNLHTALKGCARAIAGLTQAIAQAAPEKQPRLRAKLDHFIARQHQLQARHSQLLMASPLRQQLLRAHDQLAHFRESIGLPLEEARLTQLLRDMGRRSGQRGQQFEQAALQVARHSLAPALSASHILSGVTLGAVDTEFDLLLVRPRPQAFEVVAAVEVKSNPNDLAHGWQARRANLAWLSGTDPSLKPNRHFPTGRFSQATHTQEGHTFTFNQASFAGFQGPLPDRLYFISRPRTLWGCSSQALGRISHRISSDRHFEADNPVYLENLLQWCRQLTHPFETPDMLQHYAQYQAADSHLLWLPPQRQPPISP